MMQTILKQIGRLWQALRRQRRLDGIAFVASRGELPPDLGRKLYLVGVSPVQWAVLNCPCGCGERTNAKIGIPSRTSWSLALTAGKATLTPSLLMPINKCGSHFFVRENRIIWV
ncbi:DUF6527 family protein [Bradyrhizobium sp. URHD0069]|uniref:DUF6527 family protein n=1 Tax=Bradyrhizobium sp. URHD0069 TaxID=1380355 RepID=UPI0035286EA5